MSNYLPNTPSDQKEMLRSMGKSTVEELFSAVPPEVLVKDLKIPPGKSEMEASAAISALAAQNRVFPVIFRGAGAYKHYIPSAVRRITSNETFITAYTPYQAEISQGVLQSIFEYQSMICLLTGMDVSNAGVYDGASAAAEAMNMCRSREKQRVYVSACANPQVIETIKTYCWGYGIPVTIIKADASGKTDLAFLKKALTEGGEQKPAGVYVESPNFYGLMEDIPSFAEAAHAAGALMVQGANPLSLGIYECPAALGADIAVGEGQSLGMPLSWGGPYLGYMACKKEHMRQLPGRIVGETTDKEGRRAFVLTLQAREQHIRREKASSNICSNEALCSLTAAVYMATLGEEGFAEVSSQCHSKAVYAAEKLGAIGCKLVYQGEFFNEFVAECPDSAKILSKLEEKGILGGYPLGKNRILWCVTEVNSKEEIDTLVSLVKEAL